jgi:hypothetical protein
VTIRANFGIAFQFEIREFPWLIAFQHYDAGNDAICVFRRRISQIIGSYKNDPRRPK